MASAADLWAIESTVPWERSDFRSGLASLRSSTADAAVRYAADVRVLAELTALVPRCPRDESGATPWTSFRREVAVARATTDRAAAALVRAAQRLTTCLPVTLAALEAGSTTVDRAETLVRALDPYDDELAAAVDAELGVTASRLPEWRIQQEVRRAVQVLDPEAGAQRVATKNAARGVALCPDADDQASVTVFGPAVPVTRWYAALDEQARALKAAGDPRGLDALRFDLATSQLPCLVHVSADPTVPVVEVVPVVAGADAGRRPSFVEAASADCRLRRPVQASIVVPVETALGLSHEPGWLDGYGWVGAPTCRQLLVDAELRRVCARGSTGELVDVSDRVLRPPPTPAGVRAGLLELVLDTPTLSGSADRVEQQHDPSAALRRFVELRDRTCDGPTGTPTPAGRCHLDHEEPHPTGPTAAWNLTARADRSHQLKHYGWTPLRTPRSTIWTSPAGQVVEVLHHTAPPPGIDQVPGQDAGLPDPDELDLLDRAQLQAPDEDDAPPWLPESERDRTTWTWVSGTGTAPGDDAGLDDLDGIAC